MEYFQLRYFQIIQISQSLRLLFDQTRETFLSIRSIVVAC